MATTIAYDKSVQGWTSRYSYIPDIGLSLNNNFYTLKGGILWIHNSDADTANFNTFYSKIYTPTELTLIMNDSSDLTKNFKTLKMQSIGDWSAEIETNIEKGTISVDQFKDKEGNKVAFIRGEDNSHTNIDLKSANIGGIGVIDTITGSDTYNFSSIPSSTADYDLAYFVKQRSGKYDDPPILAGRITNTTGTSITLDQVGIDGSVLVDLPVKGDLVFYVKDNVVEKSGLIGFYAIIKLINNQINTDPNAELVTTPAEVYAVESEAFISSK